VRPTKSAWRAAGGGAATLLLVSLLLAGCSGGGTPSACATGTGTGTSKSSTGLTAAKGASSTTLPPSHDNDAGGARIPDQTPDADIDANQRHKSCSSSK
jgi:hypothetical protein